MPPDSNHPARQRSLNPTTMLAPLTYDLCFHGGIAGETELSCTHCNTLLAVPVNDPTYEESYRGYKCHGGFGGNGGDQSFFIIFADCF